MKPIRLRGSLLSGSYLALVFAGVLSSPLDQASGQEAPSVKSIIDKAVEAHGGAKALRRDLALERSEQCEMIIGNDKLILKSDWQYQPPDKRANQVLAKIGDLQLHVRMGIIGDKGWIKFGPAAAVDMTPEQVVGHFWEHNNHVRTVQVLADQDKEFTASPPKSTRFADKDAWQVVFTHKPTKKVVSVMFDKVTGQLLGDESEQIIATMGTKDVREKPAQFRVIFKSLVDVDGMKMPATMSISRDNVPLLEVRDVQIRVVDSIDPKVFSKPK